MRNPDPGLQQVAKKIFEELEDPKDMANCRLVCTYWRDYIDSQNHWWNLQLGKIIKCYIDLFEEDIRDVWGKIPSWVKVICHFLDNPKDGCNDFEDFKFFTKTMMEYYHDELKGAEWIWRREVDTPLHWAIERHKSRPGKKSMEFIRILPLGLIDMHEQYKIDSPLHAAIAYGNKEAFELILNAARDVREGNNDSDEDNDDWEDIDEEDDGYFFVPPVNFLNGSTRSGFTALHQACYSEDPEYLETLIKVSETKGIDLNAKSEIRERYVRDISVMHHATRPFDNYYHGDYKKNATALKVLLKYAEEKNIRLFCRDGTNYEPLYTGLWTPFEYACQYGNVEAVEVFMEYFKEKGINVTDHQMMPLTCACKRTDIYDDDDWKTFHDDHKDARTEIAKILVKHYEENNIDLKVNDDYDPLGRNALHHACASGSTEIVCLLLEHGFGDKINTTDENGRTPLHHACSVYNEEEEGPGGYPETIQFLLGKMEELGLDPNIKDKDGRTALQSMLNMDMYLGDETKKEITAIFAKYGITEGSE